MGIKVKLKYYLRGLGIGIIVTALLMGVSDKNKVTAKTDDYTVTSEISVHTTADDLENIDEENTDKETTEDKTKKTEAEKNETVVITLPTEASNADSSKETSAEGITQEEILQNETLQSEDVCQNEETVSQPETEEESTDELSKEVQDLIQMTKEASTASEYTLEIVRGDDSGTVSRKLQNAGIVENATEFDAFLMQHGYDKKISIGTVKIQKGASWVEIAEKLSGK